MRVVLSAGLLMLCAAPASGQRARELGTFPVQLAVGTSPTLVQVTWQAVLRSSAYDVERCEGAGLTTCALKVHLLATQALKLDDQLFKGGTYLYRVTAFGTNQLPMSQGQVAYMYTEPPTAVLMPPPGGFITPTPAGPSQLTASSPVPGQIHLSWSLVPYATSYHVLRSVVGYAGEQELPPPDNNPYGNTPYRYIDAPVDFRWTYSYKVYAKIKPGTVEVQTAWSPVATAKSLPFVQVSGLSYSLAPSVQMPGRLNLTIRWNAVAGAEKYIVWDKTYNTLLREVPGAIYTESNYSTKLRFTVCVGAQYPYNIRQPATEPCIDIQT
jgi:hypothetical protein